ncbi:unnamed protein product [Amoebophrya sp. A25]|nr:unnamed protein product [Amoebophrya sp. A25]|eukprot:GSA25T00019761001.1
MKSTATATRGEKRTSPPYLLRFLVFFGTILPSAMTFGRLCDVNGRSFVVAYLLWVVQEPATVNKSRWMLRRTMSKSKTARRYLI